MLLEIASTLCGNVLFGHPPGPLEWLGSHQPPVENQIEKVATYPDPLIFFKKYVRLGKPLIFRHLAASMPAHQLWTDSYLR